MGWVYWGRQGHILWFWQERLRKVTAMPSVPQVKDSCFLPAKPSPTSINSIISNSVTHMLCQCCFGGLWPTPKHPVMPHYPRVRKEAAYTVLPISVYFLSIPMTRVTQTLTQNTFLSISDHTHKKPKHRLSVLQSGI